MRVKKEDVRDLPLHHLQFRQHHFPSSCACIVQKHRIIHRHIHNALLFIDLAGVGEDDGVVDVVIFYSQKLAQCGVLSEREL